jgi:glycosyltransferase involved in cell wall biosynthesis
MKVLLIGNYAPDRQQSMLRFEAMLHRELSRRGAEVRTIRSEPAPALSLLDRIGPNAIRKWRGYFDKYLLFPRHLTEVLRKIDPSTVIHVVDHSNSVYLSAHQNVPWIVTCHDLLAVRGALGEEPSCPATAFGRQLQRRIVRGLERAFGIAAVSDATLRDVERLVAAPASQRRRTIPLGFGYPYRRQDTASALRALTRLDSVPWHRPFLLHVGSNLARKNKPAIIRILRRIADRWPGNLVFCGAPLTPELARLAENADISHRVFSVVDLSEAELESVYSLAHALVYPSICEGFGWPVIEAQACGCPVICSDRTSLPEVAGEGALVFALADELGMADAIVSMENSETRQALLGRAERNVRRFSAGRMIDEYCELYSQVGAGQTYAYR